jgi:hypothetical protein
MKDLNITREDVLSVAKKLGFAPSEEDIKTIIVGLPDEAASDPTGDWVLWVENLLHINGVGKATAK